MNEYEALGRYTAFKEEAERWARERNKHLSDLKSLIVNVTGFDGANAFTHGFNDDRAAEILAKAAHANREMLAAVAQLNEAAAACGKPTIKVVTR